MLYQNLHVFARALRAIDAGLLVASALLPWWLGFPADAWEGVRGSRVLLFVAVHVLAFTIIARRLGIYHTRRTETLNRELSALFETSLLALGLAVLAMELTSRGLPGPAYLVIGSCGVGVLPCVRIAVRSALRGLRRRGRDYRSWLLVGRNARSAAIAREIMANPHYGIRIIGIADSPTAPMRGAPDPAAPFREPPLSDMPTTEFRGPGELQRLLASHVIDEVIVTLPLRSCYDQVSEVIRLCGSAGISVKLPTQNFDRVDGNTEIVRLGNLPFVTHFWGPANATGLAVKRLVDFVVAACGLLLLLPVFAAAAIAIRLDSAGPVFFRQTRVGLNGRLFTLVKFRTMVVDAVKSRATLAARNQADGPVFKIRNDPRITRVGRVLRKYYLDELPQLWNVLMGEMSLVGPRPPLPEETEHYEWYQRRRLSMPPGLTCLWQVRADHTAPFNRWMALDLEYIDRWSLGLDLRLLVETSKVVARGQGW